jgi:hypothetical protein
MLRRRCGRVLLGGWAVLTLASCGSTPSPTAAADWGPAMPSIAGSPSSLVGGVVVDAANRPLAGVTIEWTAVAATSATSWGDSRREVETSADGAYGMVVGNAGGAVNLDGGFLIRASKPGYSSQQVQARLAESACSWNEPRCSLTVNFRLAADAN